MSENAIKAADTANLLRQDLNALVASDDPILAAWAYSILERFAPIESEVKRLGEVV